MQPAGISDAKIVVLTGASSGIGDATTRYLARQGLNLYIGVRRLGRLTRVRDDLRAEDCHVQAMVLEVTRLADLQGIVAKAQAARERVDVLINNSGVMPLSPLAALKVEEWNRAGHQRARCSVRHCRCSADHAGSAPRPRCQ